MIVGFNHNITYRGVCFHVQTEDSGIRSPHLITLLYHGGTIICSQKTSYADILNVDDLDRVVEDLAKEQHKGMLRRLKKGEFDQRIGELGIQLKTAPPGAPQETTTEPSPPPKEPGSKAVAGPETVAAADLAREASGERPAEPVSTETAAPGLDDLIFSYLSGDDGKE